MAKNQLLKTKNSTIPSTETGNRKMTYNRRENANEKRFSESDVVNSIFTQPVQPGDKAE